MVNAFEGQKSQKLDHVTWIFEGRQKKKKQCYKDESLTWVKPKIKWLCCLELKYVHLCSPEEFMFRAFNMVLEPRAGRCCLVKTEEVLELFIGLHNIWIVTWQCRHDSSSLNYHCTPPAAYQSPLLPMLPMDPTGFPWISIKLRTVMWHNHKMLYNESKKRNVFFCFK